MSLMIFQHTWLRRTTHKNAFISGMRFECIEQLLFQLWESTSDRHACFATNVFVCILRNAHLSRQSQSYVFILTFCQWHEYLVPIWSFWLSSFDAIQHLTLLKLLNNVPWDYFLFSIHTWERNFFSSPFPFSFTLSMMMMILYREIKTHIFI